MAICFPQPAKKGLRKWALGVTRGKKPSRSNIKFFIREPYAFPLAAKIKKQKTEFTPTE